MENVIPIIQFNRIKEKYLSFILTTVCRSNQDLYNELKTLFLNNELIWRDIILQSVPKYLVGNKDEFNSLDSFQFNSLKNPFLSTIFYPVKRQKHFIKYSVNYGLQKSLNIRMPFNSTCHRH